MRKLVLLLFSFINLFFAQGQSKPFPQAISWPGIIKPSLYTQTQLNSDVQSRYTHWKENYLKNNLSSLVGGYYVAGDVTGSQEGYTALGSSESQGFGMIVTVLMAGNDPNAKTYFDGLHKTYRSYFSSINPKLMGWVVADDKTAQNHFDSSTDGDLEIAYALLLANEQWGSDGAINYLQEAKDMINDGIKISDMTTTSKRTNLGDWSTNQYNTRPSDWMTDHMRAFQKATNDSYWQQAADTVYAMINSIRTNYSASTGLIPDFVVNKIPQPAPANFLEDKTDGDFSWNACRVPWRIAMDYVHYKTPDAKKELDIFVNWAKSKTSNKPQNFTAGYKLNGTPLVTYNDISFISPLMAASTVNQNNQDFLNTGWELMRTWNGTYYDESINLLCMLFISGNWWKPFADSSSEVYSPSSEIQDIALYPNPMTGDYLKIKLPASCDQTIVSIYDISGRLVVNESFYKTNFINLNKLENLMNGVYLVEVQNNENNWTKKIIVSRQ